MKKWFLIGGIVVLVVVAVVLVLGVKNLGPMIKTGVNTYGPKITQTNLSIGDVKISLLSGEATLQDFLLGNPKGFTSSEAVKVGSVFVDVDEKSITGDTFVIDRIEVVKPRITYEKSKGTDNFQTILNNVKKSTAKYGSKQPAAEKSEKSSGGKKMVIKDFVIKDAEVNLVASLLGSQTISAALPDIHLKNVGQKEGGGSPAEAFEEIFNQLYAQITGQAMTDIFNQNLKSLGVNMDSLGGDVKKQLEAASPQIEKKLNEVTDKFKGLFGN